MLIRVDLGDAAEYCDYNHGERLTPGEQLVLKQKAKSRSCPRKGYCRELDCMYTLLVL